jgi:hypothetical protein
MAQPTLNGGLAKLERSTNGGVTWTDITANLGGDNYLGTQGGYDNVVAVDPFNTQEVFVAGQVDPQGTPPGSLQGGILESQDGGTTWREINKDSGGLGPHTDYHALAYDSNGRLVVGNDGGVWRLDGNDLHTPDILWKDLNSNLEITQFRGLALDPTNSNIAFAGSQDNGTEVFNDSRTWTEFATGDGGMTLVDPTNPQIVYQTSPGPNIRQSTNGGASYTDISGGLTGHVANVAPITFFPGTGIPIFATEQLFVPAISPPMPGIFWQPLGTIPNPDLPINSVTVAPSDPNTIYVSSGGSVFVTTNQALTWTNITPPFSLASKLNTSLVRAIAVDPSNSQIAYVTLSTFTVGGTQVYETTDGGTTWTDITGNLPPIPVWSVALLPSFGEIVVGTDVGVYATGAINGSNTQWYRFGAGLPNAQVVALETATYNGTTVLAASTHGRGLWEVPVDTDLDVATTGPTTITAGTTATYTVTVTNNGPAIAQNVTLTDVVTTTGSPLTISSATQVSGPDNFGTASLLNNSAGFGPITVGSGNTDVFQIVVVVPTTIGLGSTITDTATVATTTPDSSGEDTSSPVTSGTVALATVAAGSSSAPYSSTATSVTLSATVMSPAGTVSEGNVTFTLQDSTGHVVGSQTMSGTVMGGSVSMAYGLPAGLAPGTYTVLVSYSDSSPGNFVDDGTDTQGTLTIAGATASAASQTLTYSTTLATVTLSATVTSNIGTVNTGNVTFTLLDSLGHTIGMATPSSTVTGGSISVPYSLPQPLNAGSYTIDVAYNDSSGTLGALPSNAGTLTVTPAKATVAAGSQSVPFSPTATTITLSATLNSSGGTVSEGQVTFTLKDSTGKTISGTPIASTMLASGLATVAYAVPAGLAPGLYTLGVTYTDSSPGNFVDDGTDTHGTLTVAGATASAASQTVSYSTTLATVTLSATVTSNIGTVNTGNVTFTLLDSHNHTIGTATTSGTVTGGSISVPYSLPQPLNAGSYTIDVSYSDSSGTLGALPSNAGTLTVAPAKATVQGDTASLAFNPAQNSVDVGATIISAGGTVNEGSITFTLKNSSGTLVAPALTGNAVTGGSASGTFNLGAPLPAGAYTLAVKFSDTSPGNFVDDGTDTAGMLTVGQAFAFTTAAQPASVTFSSNGQMVPLTASITSPSGVVNEGMVTFNVLQGGVRVAQGAGMVRSGQAQASPTLPPGQGAGSYTIQVLYSDTAGNFVDAGDTNTSLTVNPAGTMTNITNYTVPFSSAGQALVVSATVMAPGLAPVMGQSVMFTLSTGNGQTVSAVGNVVAGVASATLQIPGGLAAGSYGLTAAYTPTANFQTSMNNSQLTVTPAAAIPGIASSTSSTSSASSTSKAFVGKAPSFTVSQSFFGSNVQAFDPSGKQIGPTVFLSLFMFPFPVVSSVSIDASGNLDIHLSGLLFGLFPLAFDVFFSPSGGMTSFAIG